MQVRSNTGRLHQVYFFFFFAKHINAFKNNHIDLTQKVHTILSSTYDRDLKVNLKQNIINSDEMMEYLGVIDIF